MYEFNIKLKRKITKALINLLEKNNKTEFNDVLNYLNIETINPKFRNDLYDIYKECCEFNNLEPSNYTDKKILRYYQENALNQINIQLNDKSRCLCVMPTGAGKTILAYSVIASNISSQKQIIIIISPLIRLNKQNINTTNLQILSNNNYNRSNNNNRFKTIEVNCKNNKWQEEYFKHKSRNIIFSTTYKSISKLNNFLKQEKLTCNMVIFDECHIINQDLHYKDYLQNLKKEDKEYVWYDLFKNTNLYKKRLFLTATPINYQIKNCYQFSSYLELYGETVKPITIKELIDNKFLANIIPYIVNIRNSEQSEDGQFNSNEFNADVAESVMNFAINYNRKRVCIFVNRLENGKRLIKHFKKNNKFIEQSKKNQIEIYGYFDNYNNDEYLNNDSEDKLTDDEKVLKAFGQAEKPNNFDNNKIKIIVSCRKMIMGIDIPSIDSIVFADRKLSMTDIAQCNGRGMRMFKYSNGTYKDCMLLLVNTKDNKFNDMICSFINYVKINGLYEINPVKLSDKSNNSSYMNIANVPEPLYYDGSLNFDIEIMDRYRELYDSYIIKKLDDLINILRKNNIKNIEEFEDFKLKNKYYQFKDLSSYRGFNFQCVLDPDNKKYYKTYDECINKINEINKNGLKYYINDISEYKKITRIKQNNIKKYYNMIDSKIPNMDYELFYGN